MQQACSGIGENWDVQTLNAASLLVDHQYSPMSALSQFYSNVSQHYLMALINLFYHSVSVEWCWLYPTELFYDSSSR